MSLTNPLSATPALMHPPRRHFNFKSLVLLLFAAAVAAALSLAILLSPLSSPPLPRAVSLPRPPPTSLRDLLFGIASSARSWPARSPYVRAWYRPGSIRAFVFLDAIPANHTTSLDLPPLRVSEDSSRFPFTYRSGPRSAVRVARVAAELVAELERTELVEEVRWVVLGDDDTVFVPENLVATLGKHDWRRWMYVGWSSESVEQNMMYSYEMGFGGGGFAISYPLARVLGRVLDSCLMRYGHLYGSDARVYSCLAELGVGLTKEPGFHQIDMRGDLFGMLSAHPLSPLVSLHHLDYVEPIFPKMTRIHALEHLFQAVQVDPGRILQQTVCYDRSHSRTVSVSWGYAVQVFEGNQRLPDLLSLQRTFLPWRRNRHVNSSQYIYNTREVPKDPCKRPAIFFLESIVSSTNNTRSQSHYRRHVPKGCPLGKAPIKNLEQIKVFAPMFVLDPAELSAPRRHCCDILPPSSNSLVEIEIRKCKDDELISMHF